MPTIDPVEIVGLTALVRSLRALGSEGPKAVRKAANDAANLVVRAARPKVPKRSGRAARSIRATSTGTASKVTSGGARAPYMPWLDYGGRVGRNDTASRPFYPDGRYVYPTYRERKPEFEKLLRDTIAEIAERSGLEVT
jgi:hypothetical protein